MITTPERKKIIKERIDFSDEATLEKIEKVLEEDTYVFSEDQLLKIEEAKAQYEKGEFITHEKQQKEMKKWLEEQEKLFGQ